MFGSWSGTGSGSYPGLDEIVTHNCYQHATDIFRGFLLECRLIRFMAQYPDAQLGELVDNVADALVELAGEGYDIRPLLHFAPLDPAYDQEQDIGICLITY